MPPMISLEQMIYKGNLKIVFMSDWIITEICFVLKFVLFLIVAARLFELRINFNASTFHSVSYDKQCLQIHIILFT